jgi:hypothetical protein
MTRDQARGLIHATHFDPHDQVGSSPAPKIHTMAHLPPRTGAPFRGRPMPLEPVTEQPSEPSSRPIQQTRPKKKAKKKQPTKKK